MTKHFAVIGGDFRLGYVADRLIHLGHTVATWEVPGHANTEETLIAALTSAEYVILPMPVLGKNGQIKCAKNVSITPAEIADALPENAVVFGGKFDTSLACFSAKAKTVDYFTWESLTIANAVPTAEGAIQLAMEHMPSTIHGSYILVTGAGRIGMCLAKKLKALGAAVTVSARNAKDFARIQAEGLSADKTGQYVLGLKRYDCIFNTIPAKVFSHEQLKTAGKDCVFIELASYPGGFPENFPAISGAALPGIVAPKRAGEIIVDEILSFLDGEAP